MQKSDIKIKPNQNALSGFKLMPRDRLLHIYYKIHVCVFPQVATLCSKQYLQQLMIPESVLGVYRKGAVVLQVTKARYLMSVKTENNGVSVSRQCFSYKCHVSNIDFHKSPIKEPLPSPATSSLAPLCLTYSRCLILCPEVTFQ